MYYCAYEVHAHLHFSAKTAKCMRRKEILFPEKIEEYYSSRLILIEKVRRIAGKKQKSIYESIASRLPRAQNK